jgi:glycosyltransferase involved in cell wall biosynthesis
MRKERPLKIATVHAADHGGGAERSVLTLHRALLARGNDSRLHVGYLHLDEPQVFEIPRTNPFRGCLGTVRAIESATGLQDLYAPGLRRILRQLSPDVDIVHLNSLWGSGHYADVGAIALAAKRFPTLLTLRDEWMMTGHCACTHHCNRWRRGCGRCPDLAVPPAVPRDATRLNALRKRWVVQRSRLHITTVSEALRRQAEQSPILAGKPITVIHNGIDVKVFSPGDRRIARRELGLPEDGVMLLLAGQTIEGINQGIAQQAAAALNRIQDPHITALLVGRSAPKVAATLSVPFHILPFQKTPEQMASCYRAADITLVSSEVETFGRIAAESQACGTPVITSDAGGLPEVVGHGVGGLVVPNRSVEGFEAALRQLLPNQDHQKYLAQGGLEWVRERFGDEHITQQYLNLYQQLRRERGSQ